MSRVELLTIGPHYFFETALRTLCLKKLEDEATLGHDVTCDDCEAVLAVYRRDMLLPEGDRCVGTTRQGYRCQRDGIYNGYCPSHIDQDPARSTVFDQVAVA